MSVFWGSNGTTKATGLEPDATRCFGLSGEGQGWTRSHGTARRISSLLMVLLLFLAYQGIAPATSMMAFGKSLGYCHQHSLESSSSKSKLV